MNLLKIISGAIIIIIMNCNNFANATNLKFGFVDKQVLAHDSLYAQSVTDKMKKEFGSRQEALVAKDKLLRSKFEELERNRDILSESERVKKEREITKLQQSLQEDGNSIQEDFTRHQEKEAIAFNKILKDVLSDIAKDEELDLILDQQLALYNKYKSDYTYKVLQKLDQKYKGIK